MKQEGIGAYGGLTRHRLGSGHDFWVGGVPPALRFEAGELERLWSLHPGACPVLMVHGRSVVASRWQQAYGRDYEYSGQVNAALPLETLSAPVPRIGELLAWCRSTIDSRLDGLLLNWYDGGLGHYIGKHRDSIRGLVEGAPIVTVSLGETRCFRLRPWRGEGRIDFEARDGALFVMPYATNLGWTHEVPRSRRAQGRRISITLRAFT